MNRGILVSTLMLGILGAAGCSRGVQNEAAVRQGVIDYLSQRSDLNTSQLDVEVSAVSFRENEADATVSIRPKGSGPGGGMQIRYTLERKGNRWAVKRKGSGQQQHGMTPMPGAGGAMPPGHPPVAPPKGSEKEK